MVDTHTVRAAEARQLQDQSTSAKLLYFGGVVGPEGPGVDAEEKDLEERDAKNPDGGRGEGSDRRGDGGDGVRRSLLDDAAASSASSASPAAKALGAA